MTWPSITYSSFKQPNLDVLSDFERFLLWELSSFLQVLPCTGARLPWAHQVALSLVVVWLNLWADMWPSESCQLVLGIGWQYRTVGTSLRARFYCLRLTSGDLESLVAIKRRGLCIMSSSYSVQICACSPASYVLTSVILEAQLVLDQKQIHPVLPTNWECCGLSIGEHTYDFEDTLLQQSVPIWYENDSQSEIGVDLKHDLCACAAVFYWCTLLSWDAVL